MDRLNPSDFIIEGPTQSGQNNFQNRIAVGAAILLGVIVLMVLFGPLLSGYDVETISADRNLPPSAAHWFGTDTLGRDVFIRVCAGGRVSVAIGLTGALVVVVLGSLYGGLAALWGGAADEIMMRLVDILSSVPHLLVVILLSVHGAAGSRADAANRAVGLCACGAAHGYPPRKDRPAAPHPQHAQFDYRRRDLPHPGLYFQRSVFELCGSRRPAAADELGRAGLRRGLRDALDPKLRR